MVSRRDFVKRTSASLAATPLLTAPLAGIVLTPEGAQAAPAPEARAPELLLRRAVRPVVISDYSGWEFRNGGTENAVQRAFRLITEGKDVLDALIAGVNIPELDPLETGIGYGALPNADGVVQLDASCMHGPRKRAGAVACIEGVRTPSLVAQAVMDYTDHHLLSGIGAREFARQMGFTIEDDLNTETSRRLWREWKRRVDPEHWLDPKGKGRAPKDRHEKDPGDAAFAASPHRVPGAEWESRALAAGRSMVRDGLLREGSFWGTINCDGIGPNGDICGVTTTSGLAWKIPGRTGDSPILGAGLYVDNDVGAAGSTGRGEANLYNLSSFLIVESMRRGMSPKDAGMEALKRIKANTVESRLLNARGNPNFNIRFFVLNKRGEWAGVSMYHAGETKHAVCTENGAQAVDLEPLLAGTPED
ncbi:MAG TPA: N(4)-(beta-N-acetylglucosaminyl)-L-asparaginase [Gemmatimonadaceae bacterium]|nr:N(4)-(beta-N-acetylglucosaminyl)-L-asparaginase [Gemmatimonadaceae bacterium]